MSERSIARLAGCAFACVAMAAMLLGGCSRKPSSQTNSSGGTSAGKGELTIAVIPKGTTHSYWNAVKAGAEKAGAELHVKIIWKGPLKEDDRSDQIKILSDFVNPSISGICIAPLDETALADPIAAADKKMPVVIFDSAVKGQVGKDFVSLVATDNRKAGAMGGAELARLLNDKGNVVLLRYAEGHASTTDREEGFLAEMAKHPDIHIIQKDRFAGATASEAQTVAANLIDKLKMADGIFCPNESSTQGMLLALQANNLTGKVKFVGFDASKMLVDALRQGDIQALVTQDPQKMGYLAVQTVVKAIHGQKVPPSIDTGAALVTKANLSDPNIRKMIGE